MNEHDKKIGLIFNDIARFRGIIFDQIMSSHGVTHVQAFVLNHLFRKDGLTQTKLADLMDVGTVTVSGLVDRLEAKGWVERRADKKDRRANRVWLMPKVENIKKKMIGSIIELNSITLDGMSREEIDQLASLLRQAKSKLVEYLGKPNKT